MKRAFLFSGQGAQYSGMGRELHDSYPVAQRVFEEASDVLGYNMKALCFDDNQQLNHTEFTQPAILTVNHAFFEIAIKEGLKPDMLAGLSLGEYNALIASGALSFSETVSLVAKRGKFMAEAVPQGSGKMVAIMNAEVALIEKICREVSEETDQIVVPANYNTPQQIVIGGDVAAVDLAIQRLAEQGVKRCIALNVSGPFHTPLLKSASIKLAEELNKLSFGAMKIPVISNTTADVMELTACKSLLERQVMEPVRFYDSIATMKALGVTEFVEIGPGKVLTGFLKKIDKELNHTRIENKATLDETLAFL